MFLLCSFTHLEDFIQNLYFKINITSPTQLGFAKITDALNIGVFTIPSKSQAIEFNGKHYIFLNAFLTDAEKFEEFGHELGHTLLHASDQQHMAQDYRMYQEWKANLFALHFCIPTFMLQQLSHYELNAYKTSEIFGVTEEFAQKRLDIHEQKMFNMKISRTVQQQSLYSN